MGHHLSVGLAPCREGPGPSRSQACLGCRPATHSSAWALSICFCANVSAGRPAQTASFFAQSSLCAARVPGSNPGRAQLDPAFQAAPTFWNAVAAHPWPSGCGVREPPLPSSSWGPTCCLPPRAGASAGSAGFSLSPVERPGGRGLPGARGAARRKLCGAPPSRGAERGAWRRYGGGRRGGALPGPAAREPAFLRLCRKR